MFNTTLFEVSIFRKKLDHINNGLLQKFVLDNYTNNDRFVSKDEKCLEDLNIEVLKECQSILNYIKADPSFTALNVQINDVWVNYNYTDYILEPHTHKRSFLSAVYYPLSYDGKISFHSPFSDAFLSNLPPSKPERYNTHNASSWTFEVETGDLIIFNSQLLHYVPPAMHERMSIVYDVGAVLQ